MDLVMNDHSFRLRVINLGAGLAANTTALEVGERVRLCTAGRPFADGPREIYLRGGRFPDQATAEQFAHRYADALRLAGVILHWPLRVAPDASETWVNPILSTPKQFVRSGSCGFIVYPDPPETETKFHTLTATLSAICRPGRFILGIESGLEALAKRGALTRREQIACDFLAASVELQSSPAPSFVTRVSAVEVLVSQRPRSAEFRIRAEELAGSANSFSELSEVERSDLSSACQRTKSEGVMAGIRRICLPLMGHEWMTAFSKLYGVRSKIVHDGITPTPEDCRALLGLVEQLFDKMPTRQISD